MPLTGQGVMKTNAKARVHKTAAQVLDGIVNDVLLVWQVEDYDPGSNFDLGNDKFVAPVAGYYFVHGCITHAIGSIPEFAQFVISIAVEGSPVSEAHLTHMSEAQHSLHVTDIVHLAVGEEVTLLFSFNNVDSFDTSNVADQNYMVIHLISAD